MKQMVVQVNLNRTGLGASAAQRTGERQMFPLLQPAQMRGQHRSDRPRVSGSIGMPAYVFKNRTNVQAGAAADAMQRIALLTIREQFGASVIQKDHVIFLGAVEFPRLARAGVK